MRLNINKTNPFLIVFLFMLYLSNVNARIIKSNLIVPQAFRVIAVNGRVYAAQTLRSSQNIPLKLGQNRLALKYQVDLKTQNVKNRSLESNILLVTFYLKEKDNLRLTFIKPATKEAAIRYSKAPYFTFINENQLPLNINIVRSSNKSLNDVVKRTKNSNGIKLQPKPIIIKSNNNR